MEFDERLIGPLLQLTELLGARTRGVTRKGPTPNDSVHCFYPGWLVVGIYGIPNLKIK